MIGQQGLSQQPIFPDPRSTLQLSSGQSLVFDFIFPINFLVFPRRRRGIRWSLLRTELVLVLVRLVFQLSAPIFPFTAHLHRASLPLRTIVALIFSLYTTDST